MSNPRVVRMVTLLAGSALLAHAAAPPTRAGGPVHWETLNEPGCGGWITSFIVSPHDSKRCLMGGDMLGIGWSDDRGDSWHPAFGLPSWEICHFSWHPTDPNVVWVGTFSGPCRSPDGGKTGTVKRNGFPPVSGRHGRRSSAARSRRAHESGGERGRASRWDAAPQVP